MIRVTVWNENLHEQRQEEVRALYPQGIHGCIKEFLSKNSDFEVRTATLEEPEHGLTQEVLDNTDVLIYWSHIAQDDFSDEVAERIQQAVLKGMGVIALHSAHYSKMMKKLLGTSMTLRWRHGDRERLFVTSPAHPIAKGLPEYFELPMEEMYGEYFDIPKPDDVVFTGWFAGGEVFRSGCTFQRGLGKIFYFQPGHEQYPIYHDANIQKVITNAVYWCQPVSRREGLLDCTEVKVPLEKAADICLPTDSEEVEEIVTEIENVAPAADVKKSDKPKDSKSHISKLDIRLSIFHEHIREAAIQTGRPMSEIWREAFACGIQGVEVEYSTVKKEPALLGAIKEAGLEVSNMYQFFDFGKDYQGGIDLGMKMLEEAKLWDIKRVMIIPGFIHGKKVKEMNACRKNYAATKAFMERTPEIIAMRDALRILVSYANELGIIVSMEDFDSYDSPIAGMNELRWFLEEVPGLKHTLDMGNYVYSDEDVEEAYDLFKDSIVHVHCKDRGIEKESRGDLKGLGLGLFEKPVHRQGLKPVPVGQGYMPIEKLINKLEDAGYEGYLAIEHFGAKDQLGFMKASAEFLVSL